MAAFAPRERPGRMESPAPAYRRLAPAPSDAAAALAVLFWRGAAALGAGAPDRSEATGLFPAASFASRTEAPPLSPLTGRLLLCSAVCEMLAGLCVDQCGLPAGTAMRRPGHKAHGGRSPPRVHQEERRSVPPGLALLSPRSPAPASPSALSEARLQQP
ncbi:hypothetical protein AAFF_G00309540 [Aldrovandia affinis]|uniref:Uncharacterized protein n=1 Tax=Aldrovandia affinis TaxID=143900 RepID=A0AAD7SP01_9TELE|nr:hypothetical protein AAFF_G00309540 [Aldrovandia affinis]